jgi:hypothetical protein
MAGRQDDGSSTRAARCACMHASHATAQPQHAERAAGTDGGGRRWDHGALRAAHLPAGTQRRGHSDGIMQRTASSTAAARTESESRTIGQRSTGAVRPVRQRHQRLLRSAAASRNAAPRSQASGGRCSDSNVDVLGYPGIRPRMDDNGRNVPFVGGGGRIVPAGGQPGGALPWERRHTLTMFMHVSTTSVRAAGRAPSVQARRPEPRTGGDRPTPRQRQSAARGRLVNAAATAPTRAAHRTCDSFVGGRPRWPSGCGPWRAVPPRNEMRRPHGGAGSLDRATRRPGGHCGFVRPASRRCARPTCCDLRCAASCGCALAHRPGPITPRRRMMERRRNREGTPAVPGRAMAPCAPAASACQSSPRASTAFTRRRLRGPVSRRARGAGRRPPRSAWGRRPARAAARPTPQTAHAVARRQPPAEAHGPPAACPARSPPPAHAVTAASSPLLNERLNNA